MTPHNPLVWRAAKCGYAAAAQLRRYAPFYRALCYAAVLALASKVGRATIVEPRELSELVREAEYIGSVWIEWSMEGPAAPLLDRRLKIVSQGQPGDRWVWQPYFLRDIGPVAQLNEQTLSMVLLSASPTTPYPAGTYLYWKAVRDVLLRAVVPATSGKAPSRTRAK